MPDWIGKQQIMDRLQLPWAEIWRRWRYERLPLVWVDGRPTIDAEALAAWEADRARWNQ